MLYGGALSNRSIMRMPLAIAVGTPSIEHVEHPIQCVLSTILYRSRPSHAERFVKALRAQFLLLSTIPSRACWTQSSDILVPAMPYTGHLVQSFLAQFLLTTSTIASGACWVQRGLSADRAVQLIWAHLLLTTFTIPFRACCAQ